MIACLALVGCDNKAPMAPGYVNPTEQTKQLEFSDKTPSTKLEGIVLDAQPQTLPFHTSRRLSKDEGFQNHPITYIPIDSDGKKLVFVYPFPVGVHPNSKAEINYIPGDIDSRTLLKNFVNSCFDTQDNFPLGVSGVIRPNGIKYKEAEK